MESETETDDISVIEPRSESPALPHRECCIGGCNSTTEKSKSEHLLFLPSTSVSFHKLPAQPFGLRQAWINIIRASRSEPEWLPGDGDSVFVCNLHFNPHEIVIPLSDDTVAQLDFSEGKNIVPSLRLGDYGVTKIVDNDDDEDESSKGNGILENDLNSGDTSFNFIPIKVKEEPKSEDEYEENSFNTTFDDEQPCSSSSIIKPGKRKPKPTWSLRELWDDDDGNERNEQEENDSSEYEPSSDSDSDVSDTERRRNGGARGRDGDFDDDEDISNSSSSKRPKLSTPNQKFVLQSSKSSVNSMSTPKNNHIPNIVSRGLGVIRKQLQFHPGGAQSAPSRSHQSGSNSSPNFLNFQLQAQMGRSPGRGGMSNSSQFMNNNNRNVPTTPTTIRNSTTVARKRILMPGIASSDPVLELVTLMQHIQSKNKTTIDDNYFYDQCIALFNRIFDRLKIYPPSEMKKNVSLQLSVLVDIAKQRKTQGNSTANQVHFSLVSKKILELLISWPKDPTTRPPPKVAPNSNNISPNIRVSPSHIRQAVHKTNLVPNPNVTGQARPSTTTPYGHMTKLMENKFMLNSGTGKVCVTPVQDVSKTSNLLSSRNLHNLQKSADAAASKSLKPMPALTRPRGSIASAPSASQSSLPPPEVVTLSDDDDEDDDSSFAPLIESVTTLAPSALTPNNNNSGLKSTGFLPNLSPSPTPTPNKTPSSGMSRNHVANNSSRAPHPSSDTSPVKVIHSSTVLEKFAQFTKFVLNSEVPPPLSQDQAESIHWMGQPDDLDSPIPDDPDCEEVAGTGTGAGSSNNIMGESKAAKPPTLPLGKYPPNVPIVINTVPKEQFRTLQQQPPQHQHHHQQLNQMQGLSPAGNVTASSIATGIRNALKNAVSQHQQNANRNGPIYIPAGAGGARFSSPTSMMTAAGGVPRSSASASFSQQLRHLAATQPRNPIQIHNGQHQQTNTFMGGAANSPRPPNILVSSGPSSGPGSGPGFPPNPNINQRIVLVSKANGTPTYALITTTTTGGNTSNLNTVPFQTHQQILSSTGGGHHLRPLLRPPAPGSGMASLNPNVQQTQQKISIVQREPNANEEIILLSDDSDNENGNGHGHEESQSKRQNLNVSKGATLLTAPAPAPDYSLSLNSNPNPPSASTTNITPGNQSGSGSSSVVGGCSSDNRNEMARANVNYYFNSIIADNNSRVSENTSANSSSFPEAGRDGAGGVLEDQNAADEEMLLGI